MFGACSTPSRRRRLVRHSTNAGASGWALNKDGPTGRSTKKGGANASDSGKSKETV